MKTGRIRTLSVRLVASACLLLLFSALALAQVGELAGTVRDANGTLQPGVTVELTGRSLIERVRTTTTDREGKYRFIEVPIGIFTVAFRAQGFSTLLHTNVYLSNSPAPVNARLAPGDSSHVVVVKHDLTIHINGRTYQQ
jgi:hypothetical protein